MSAITSVALLVVLTGCRDEYDAITGVCPEVESTTPLNQASGTPPGSVITVTFNTAMNPATIVPEAFSLVSSPNANQLAAVVTGTMTFDASTNTLRFVPDQPLATNAIFTGRVEPTVKDIGGNAMQEPYMWTFTTGLQSMVVSTIPSHQQTGVAVAANLSATFNVPMNPGTLNTSTFTVWNGSTQVTGVVSYSGLTATFNPNADLALNTTYEARISMGAVSAQGIALVSNFAWTFTTVAPPPPTITSVSPSQGAINVPLNTDVTAVFSVPMMASTVNTTSFTLRDGNTPITGTVTMLGNTAVFNPDNLLLSGRLYSASVTTAVRSADNIAMAVTHNWTFTTVNPAGPGNVILNSVEAYGIIAGVGISNNAGFSVVHDMNVGISPGVRSSITGYPPAIVVNGAIHASDDLVPAGIAATLLQAKQDLVSAYLYAEGATVPAPQSADVDQGGLTLAPGIYKASTSLLIQNGDLTLDAQGDVNAVWIFQIASTLTTVGGAGGNIVLTGGAQAKNIYWQVGSSATIGDNTIFKGNVLALSDITMNSGAVAQGRMLARNGSVVLTNANTITKP